MSKEKLISLIIRKDTYKDTKPFLTEILNLNDQTARISLQAITEILTTDHITQSKLYAVRFLKEAFEQANPKFIAQVQTDLLPLLAAIALDQTDEKAVIKYAGSYTKKEELEKFKSILSSLFRMTKECLLKWAQWIPDSTRRFAATLNQLKQKHVQFQFEQVKYFRPEHQQTFRMNCNKNGVRLTQSKPKVTASKVQPKKQKQKDPYAVAVELALNGMATAQTAEQINEVEKRVGDAINDYLQGAKAFKEEDMQRWLDELQKKKGQAEKRIKKGAAASQIKKQPAIADKPPETLQSQRKKEVREVTPTGESPQQTKPASSELKSKQNQKANNAKKQSSLIRIQEDVNPVASTPPLKKEPVAPEPENEEYFFKVSPPVNQKEPPAIRKTQTSPQIIPINNKQEITETEKQKQTVSAVRPTKKGPLVFQEQTEIPVKRQKKTEPIVKFQSEEKWSITNSKQSAPQPTDSKPYKKSNGPSNSKTSNQRVTFSDQSSQSEAQKSPPIQPNFHKKGGLSSIQQQQRQSPPPNKTNNSRISNLFEQSHTPRNGKGAANNTLLQENIALMEKLQRTVNELAAEKEEKLKIIREKKEIEKESSYQKEVEQKMARKIKASVPMEDYNRLRREMEQERDKYEMLVKEHVKLRTEYEYQSQQLQDIRSKLKTGKPLDAKNSPDSNIESRLFTTKQRSPAPITTQEIDPDYVNNLTHPSHMHRWLNAANTLLFKKSVLNCSELFYHDDYLSILSHSNVYTQNHQQFLSLSLTFQFKSLKQVVPQLRYKNCQQLDLWIKPLAGNELQYTQELAVRLCSNPIKIIKAEIKIVQHINLTVLLPFMYLNFLREEDFNAEQFEEIFNNKAQQLIKSKIVQWNQSILREVTDLKLLFKSSTLTDNKLRFCLSEGINDQIFMIQIDLLRNSKLMLRVLPIPHSPQMLAKAKELLDDLIFLLS